MNPLGLPLELDSIHTDTVKNSLMLQSDRKSPIVDFHIKHPMAHQGGNTNPTYFCNENCPDSVGFRAYGGSRPRGPDLCNVQKPFIF